MNTDNRNYKNYRTVYSGRHARNRPRRRPRRRGPRIWPVLFTVVIVAAGVFMVSKLLNNEKQDDVVTDTVQSLQSGASLKDADSSQGTDSAYTDEYIAASESSEGSEAAESEESEEESAAKAPVSIYSAQGEEILSTMTLHEKICQLFIVYPEAITGVSPTLTAGEATSSALDSWPVGGFLYDTKNMQSQDQLKSMLVNVQSYTKIPLILTCDEEGGRVNRLMSNVGTTYIGPMLSYKDQGIETARMNAQTISSDMASLGFNMDLAPVADVWSNVNNTVIGDRAYSNDFQQAAELVSAAVQGFHDGGVACTIKHFPGHGDTAADTHYSSAYVSKSLDELRDNELVPFQAGIDAGADVVMIGHLIVTDVSEEPALFSYELVTQLLREEMDFQGVVITDGLEMQAISNYYTSAEVAVKAISAGVDLLLCPVDLPSAVTALELSVESGEITESRIDESVLRILTLKLECGIIQADDI